MVGSCGSNNETSFEHSLAGVGQPKVATSSNANKSVTQTCDADTRAIRSTVFELAGCNGRVDNSGLGGALNRRRSCASETVVATALSVPTCTTCKAFSELRQIRCDRGDCGTCQNPDYLNSLVIDLANGSQKVRAAATRSLRICGLRVDPDAVCAKLSEAESVVFNKYYGSYDGMTKLIAVAQADSKNLKITIPAPAQAPEQTPAQGQPTLAPQL